MELFPGFLSARKGLYFTVCGAHPFCSAANGVAQWLRERLSGKLVDFGYSHYVKTRQWITVYEETQQEKKKIGAVHVSSPL